MNSDELKRFNSKIQKLFNGCIVWTTALKNGYGVLTVNRDGKWIQEYAHRLSYEHYIGPIPNGLTLDHLCRNRPCINPMHLEVVTRGENVLRGDTIAAREKSQTHCKNGHEFTPENTRIDKIGKRSCRACHRIWDRMRGPARKLTRKSHQHNP